MKRTVAIAGFVAALLVMGAGVAVAGVSDGNYRPERQRCSGHANDTEHDNETESGCQNFTINVRDGNDHEALRAGLPQLKDGESPDPTSATVETPDEGFDPTTADRLYLGADDNLDNGEHDGSDQVGDGPSDGGAVVFNVEPNSITTWFGALMGGDTQYLATHPLPLVDAGFGSCADGVCESVQTQRRTAYDGGDDSAAPRDAANYDGYTWDPESCSGADSQPADCAPPGGYERQNCVTNTDGTETCDQGLKYWHNRAGDAYVEPGVQVYEDPNPAGSPIGPYPLPAVYAGTCGVIMGGGPAPVPASPYTNSAGQLVLTTTC